MWRQTHKCHKMSGRGKIYRGKSELNRTPVVRADAHRALPLPPNWCELLCKNQNSEMEEMEKKTMNDLHIL